MIFRPVTSKALNLGLHFKGFIMSTPLKKLPEYITNREHFKGSPVTGELVGDIYTVRSYSTVIATFNKHGGLIWFDDMSYSNTTSKLQSLIRANYSIGDLEQNAPKSNKMWII